VSELHLTHECLRSDSIGMKKLLSLLLLCSVPAFGAFPLDTSYIDTGSSKWTNFKAWVDLTVINNNRQWGFEGYHAGLVYHVIGGTAYRDACANEARNQYNNAASDIADGNKPTISGDSYLKAGPMLRDIILALAWCNDAVSAAEEANWLDYADNTVWNIWNDTQAAWGVRTPGNDTDHWSGWSNNNPGNNYFFSFLMASMYLGFYMEDAGSAVNVGICPGATCRDESINPVAPCDIDEQRSGDYWLDWLEANKETTLTSYYNDMDGGGSLEGTGYGVAQRRLFGLYRLWEDGGRGQLWAGGSHLNDSIDYWIHATSPPGDYLAPIGDWSRDEMPHMFDYYRNIMLEARYLVTNTGQKNKGTWWLNHISLQNMSRGENRDDDLLPVGTISSAPTATSYWATEVGNIFWRTDWTDEALWFFFVGGPYEEAHAHKEQGSFTIWQGDFFRAVSNNIYHNSGIEQGPDNKNLVLFKTSGGDQILQKRLQPPSEITFVTDSPQAEGETFTITADLQNAYGGEPLVNDWDRTIVFDGTNEFTITDTFDIDGGVTATWILNTPTQPTILGGGTYFETAYLRVTPTAPGSPSLSVTDMTTVSTGYQGGWRMNIDGSTTGYTVEVVVLDFQAPTPPPEPGSEADVRGGTLSGLKKGEKS